MVNLNRIARDKLIEKQVYVISGKFKGQRGLVVHMNGDMASVEMSIRMKPEGIHKNNLIEIEGGEMGDANPEDDNGMGG